MSYRYLNRCFNRKILRTNLVAYVWKNAHKSVPLEMSPTQCGWILKDGRYRIKWFAGDQIPDDVRRAIEETSEDVDVDEDRYSSASDESDNEDENDV